MSAVRMREPLSGLSEKRETERKEEQIPKVMAASDDGGKTRQK